MTSGAYVKPWPAALRLVLVELRSATLHVILLVFYRNWRKASPGTLKGFIPWVPVLLEPSLGQIYFYLGRIPGLSIGPLKGPRLTQGASSPLY